MFLKQWPSKQILLDSKKNREGGITFSDPGDGIKKKTTVVLTIFCFRFLFQSKFCTVRSNKKAPLLQSLLLFSFCGEGGIRTLGTSLSSYNGLANRPFRPLRHLSVIGVAKIKINGYKSQKTNPKFQSKNWNLGFIIHYFKTYIAAS